MANLAARQQAADAGLSVWIDGTNIEVEGDPTPKALAAVETLWEHKAEVLSFLRRVGDGHPLPWTGHQRRKKNCGGS